MTFLIGLACVIGFLIAFVLVFMFVMWLSDTGLLEFLFCLAIVAAMVWGAIMLCLDIGESAQEYFHDDTPHSIVSPT